MTLPKTGTIFTSLLEGPKQYCMIFWLGGIAALIWEYGVDACIKYANQLKGGGITFWLLGLILVIIASGNFLQEFRLFILRLLEGYYWPYPLRRAVVLIRNFWYKRGKKKYNKYAAEAEKGPDSLTQRQREKFVGLDTLFRNLPELNARLPTKVGNILRRAELHPLLHYGLDAFVCFPRLWLLLPEDVRKQVEKSREQLEQAACSWMWGALFVLWGLLAWEAIPVSLLLMIMAYRTMLEAAVQYAQLIESSFDVYRHLLYEALRLPLPSNLEDEKKQGEKITKFLWRGFWEPEGI